MTFDGIRAVFPTFGVALYALEPGRPVVLEIIDDHGTVFSFTGQTAQAAIAKAFPPIPLKAENKAIEEKEKDTHNVSAGSVFD